MLRVYVVVYSWYVHPDKRVEICITGENRENLKRSL